MTKTLPPRRGCFTASYPSTVWLETPCADPPATPGMDGGVPAEVVGGSNDYTAQVTSGQITAALGSFPSVVGVTSESDGATNNIFSLQMNTNTFDTSACSGAVGSCKGWQQFVYSNWGNVFIQYWLIGYGTTDSTVAWNCPLPFKRYHSTANCMYSTPVKPVPVQSIVNLGKLRLSGMATADGNDSVTVLTPSRSVYAVNSDSTLGLGLPSKWKSTEFNVFGDSGGSEAFFNGGASITVATDVINGFIYAPLCAPDSGTTGEKSNLFISSTCTTKTETAVSSPGIVFTETTPPTSIWSYIGPPCSGGTCEGWQQLDDNGDSMRLAGSGGYLYQLHNTGKIWKYDGTPCSGSYCPGWTMLGNFPYAAQIVASGPDLFQLQNTGEVDYFNGAKWQKLDDNPGIVTIAGAAGNLYELHNKGEIWRYTGAPCSGNACYGWQELDNNPAAVAIASGGNNLYQLHNDGSIWQYTGSPCSGGACYGWQRLDVNTATVQIVADGNSLYQRHSDGTIWKYTGTPCDGLACYGWQKLDENPADVAIAASDGNLYQLHSSGTVWKHTGTPCSGSSCTGWQQLGNDSLTGRITAANGTVYTINLPQVPVQRVLTCYECR
jgi:hypothetical protein